MKKPKGPRLSAGEMEILQMLWRQGSVALSEAQAGLGRSIGYTTMQTRLNRLVEKGVVARSADRPAHLDLLLERVSGGNIVPLVAHLVRDRALSSNEIAELKQLIQEADRQTRKAKDAKK